MRTTRLATGTAALGGRYSSIIARVAGTVLAAALSGTCRDSHAPTTPAEAITQTATVTAPGTAAILVGAGNIARCDRTNDEATAALLDRIPGTVFALGDDANPSGTAANYANCYDPSWGRHKARTSPAPGNHDYDSSATAASYFTYFGAAAGEPGKGYYSYDLGAWHIIVLNSNHTYVSTAEGSAQLAWLKADLAANSKRCVLAMWHRPRFYSTTSSAFFETPAVRPFWEYLYAAHATLIVNAHMRDYERFGPQDPAGVADPENGIRQFIVGTGGEGLDRPNTLIAPNSEVSISGVYGVLKLTLGDGTYSWQFVPVAGQTATDSGTDACHRAPGWVTVSPAGADLLVGQTVQLTATIHDGSGNVVTDGTVTWSSSDTLVATVDGNGLVTAVRAVGSPATITATSERRRGVSLVHVSLSPTTPTAAFALACSGLSCTFTDLSTDRDGRVAAWSWDFGDGTTSTSQSPSHTYGADGTYSMALTVTDDSGKAASAKKRFLVTAANPPDEVPVASFVIPYGCRFRWCNFTDASRDPDGRVVAWKWEFGDGTTSTSQSPGGHTYPAAGLYRVHLTVTDDGGATGDVTQLVQAPAPAAYFTYDCSGLTCTFTDQSTSGGFTLSFVGWYFGDGTGRRQNAYDSFEKRPPVEHTFFRSGTYTVVLSLSDGYEYLASTSKSVTVKTLHPVAGGTCSCVALACVFMDDRTDDPDGRVVAWSWDFGDGGTSVLRNPSHTYTADGTYTARLTITDDSGGTSSASWPCTVREYPGVWSTWVSLPTPRSGLGVAAIDEILYALGGDTIVDNAGGAVSTLETFEPDRQTWTTKASMPTPRYGLGVAAIDGILYAVGGASSTGNLATLEAYDPRTDTWTTKASMPTARHGLGVAAIDGMLYAVGGSNSNGELATLEAYDPRTDAWTTKASMPTPRTALGVAASNGILYAVGGSRGNGDLATLEAYDPRTDTWTTKASMPTPRAGLGFAALRGMMLCAVGGASFGPVPTYRQTVEAYHPETNSWTAKGSMPTPRYGLGVTATFHEVLWAFGGYAPGFGLLASSESFIP